MNQNPGERGGEPQGTQDAPEQVTVHGLESQYQTGTQRLPRKTPGEQDPLWGESQGLVVLGRDSFQCCLDAKVWGMKFLATVQQIVYVVHKI